MKLSDMSMYHGLINANRTVTMSIYTSDTPPPGLFPLDSTSWYS